jgi:tetratricopeptide (TPR) repeat protein
VKNGDLYKPCPCGSGKKYKFCCYAKQREAATERPTLRVLSGVEDEVYGEEWVALDEATIEAGKRECGKGLKLMGKSQFKQAIPWFRKAMERTSVVYVPANNLALCLYVTGKLDEAIAVQAKSLAESPLANPFGLANLATFCCIRGDEEAAEAYIEEAMDHLPFPSVDTCIKICEVLARFKRHKTILEVVDHSTYANHPDVSFFTGVAAANLRKRARAEADLKRVSVGYHKAEMARRYLRHLQEKSTPHTVMGDWPYLFAAEVCPLELMAGELKADEAGCRQRRIVVQFTEALLNENAVDPLNKLGFLAYAEHPDANALLWAIVKGSFGPDELRSKALNMLQERGEIKPGELLEMLVDGKCMTVKAVGIKLNPEFCFSDPLPPALEKIYVKAITDGHKRNPNWERIGNAYQQIMRAAPDFYPVRYNYAVTLVHRQRYAEAEPILRELYEKHPDYLFAASTLVQLCMVQGRDDEAKAIIESITLPAETHPAAMVSWAIAQHLYWKNKEDYATAANCLDIVRDIAPDHPILKKRR